MTNQQTKFSTLEAYNQEDYLAWEINIPKARNSFWDNMIQFNQNDRDRYGCWYHWSIGTLADNKGKWPSYKDMLDKAASWLKYDYGYQDKLGMYAYRAVDLARNLWNKNNEEKVITLRINMGSKTMEEVLDKGYSIATWYKGNADYNQDKADWHLDGTEFGSATYGHMIRITKKGKHYVVDNYYEGKDWDEDDQVYSLEDLYALIDNDVYFDNGYIFIFKNDIMTQQDKDIAEVKYALENDISNNPQILEDVKNGDYNVSVQMALMSARVHKDLSDKLQQILEAIQNLS